MNRWGWVGLSVMGLLIVGLLGYIWWSGDGGTYTITDHLSGNVDLRNEREVPVELVDKFLEKIGASAEMREQVRSTTTNSPSSTSSTQLTEEERREATEQVERTVRVVEEVVQNPLDCLAPCGKKKPRIYIEF